MGVYVYILHSDVHDRYYIGQSEDPERRLKFHNSIERGFTSRYRPWKLVFVKFCESRSEAKKLGMRIKGWKSKKMIKNLVDHGTWPMDVTKAR